VRVDDHGGVSRWSRYTPHDLLREALAFVLQPAIEGGT